MTVATLNSGTVWNPPPDCPVGTVVAVETWGAGSGGAGRVSSTFGSAGAGGAFASSTYQITPDNITNGVPYSIGGGSAGNTGANSLAGGDTSWSTANLNTVRNSVQAGDVPGTPGTLPTNMSYGALVGLSSQVVGSGLDAGLSYVDIRLFGSTAGTTTQIYIDKLCPATASVSWTISLYGSVSGGAMTNVGAVQIVGDTLTAAQAYLATPFVGTLNTSSTPTRGAVTATTNATTGLINFYIQVNFSSGVAIDVTFRLAGVQVELGASASAWKSTPGYALAKGGGPTAGTTGGVGGATATSVGTVKNSGGDGSAYNVAGAGAGGAGGKDGAGVAGNASGQGGQGDATTGGLGGAVKTTSPGDPGTANVEGGGGGGGLKTVAGTGGAGGAPGGGGGSAAVATGTGGAGANGQVRLTYTGLVVTFSRKNRTYLRRLRQEQCSMERVRRSILFYTKAAA